MQQDHFQQPSHREPQQSESDADFANPQCAFPSFDPMKAGVESNHLNPGHSTNPQGLMDQNPYGQFSFEFHDLTLQTPTTLMTESTSSGLLAFAPIPSPNTIDHSNTPQRPRDVEKSGPEYPRNHRSMTDGSSSRERHLRKENSTDSTLTDGAGSHATSTDETPETDYKPIGEDNVESAPAWSELKTKAGKDRKRLPLACITCRKKKIRCSGEKPSCKHCIRARLQCVYKVSTRKNKPKTDYMAVLDKRLERMEERIKQVLPDPSSSHTRTLSSSSNTKRQPSNGPVDKGFGGKTAVKKRSADEAFGLDLAQWARLDSEANLNIYTFQPTFKQIREIEETKMMEEGAEALPSPELQEHLGEVYFENVYGQAYSILHKPSFMRDLRAGNLPPVLVLSVCAISARFSSHPDLNSASPNFLRGEEWASTARTICTKRYDWPDITILTCLLLLGLHEFGTCNGGRSWALGGQAVRMAYALQLHRDEDGDAQSGQALSFVDREIRSRLMWACFLMDRFMSSSKDRPTFIREETIKISLPVREYLYNNAIPATAERLDEEDGVRQSSAVLGNGDKDEDEDEDTNVLTSLKSNMGAAAYMIKSISLWGRIINYLNQGGREHDRHSMWVLESEYAKLRQETEDLIACLPDSLQSSPKNLGLQIADGAANQFLFLHISLQHNILIINRAGVTSDPDAPNGFSADSSQRTFTAANRISELLREAEAHQVRVNAPFTGYCIFSASTVHISGIFPTDGKQSPADVKIAKRNLGTNIRFLTRMRRYWGMLHWMMESLRNQYRAFAEAGVELAAPSSPIFQYGDWFDRYPHGVSGPEELNGGGGEPKNTAGLHKNSQSSIKSEKRDGEDEVEMDGDDEEMRHYASVSSPLLRSSVKNDDTPDPLEALNMMASPVRQLAPAIPPPPSKTITATSVPSSSSVANGISGWDHQCPKPHSLHTEFTARKQSLISDDSLLGCHTSPRESFPNHAGKSQSAFVNPVQVMPQAHTAVPQFEVLSPVAPIVVVHHQFGYPAVAPPLPQVSEMNDRSASGGGNNPSSSSNSNTHNHDTTSPFQSTHGPMMMAGGPFSVSTNSQGHGLDQHHGDGGRHQWQSGLPQAKLNLNHAVAPEQQRQQQPHALPPLIPIRADHSSDSNNSNLNQRQHKDMRDSMMWGVEYTGQEAGPAWFVPFNTEPPKIGDFRLGMGMSGIEGQGGAGEFAVLNMPGELGGPVDSSLDLDDGMEGFLPN